MIGKTRARLVGRFKADQSAPSGTMKWFYTSLRRESRLGVFCGPRGTKTKNIVVQMKNLKSMIRMISG
jgi:hypothetical protein